MAMEEMMNDIIKKLKINGKEYQIGEDHKIIVGDYWISGTNFFFGEKKDMQNSIGRGKNEFFKLIGIPLK